MTGDMNAVLHKCHFIYYIYRKSLKLSSIIIHFVADISEHTAQIEITMFKYVGYRICCIRRGELTVVKKLFTQVFWHKTPLKIQTRRPKHDSCYATHVFDSSAVSASLGPPRLKKHIACTVCLNILILL